MKMLAEAQFQIHIFIILNQKFLELSFELTQTNENVTLK